MTIDSVLDKGDPGQLRLSFTDLTDGTVVYEYAVLVTSLDNEILTVAQRDRADAENPFEENMAELTEEMREAGLPI